MMETSSKHAWCHITNFCFKIFHEVQRLFFKVLSVLAVFFQKLYSGRAHVYLHLLTLTYIYFLEHGLRKKNVTRIQILIIATLMKRLTWNQFIRKTISIILKKVKLRGKRGKETSRSPWCPSFKPIVKSVVLRFNSFKN